MGMDKDLQASEYGERCWCSRLYVTQISPLIKNIKYGGKIKESLLYFDRSTAIIEVDYNINQLLH